MVRAREIRVEPGEGIAPLAPNEAGELAAAWVATYGRQSAPGMSKYKWHVFSYGSYPSAALDDARSLYSEALSPEYVVLANDADKGVVTAQKPIACSFSDFFVFPKNLAWTMAFTHEDGWLGPYFAKHPEFERLNAENLRSIKKAAEALEAKRKGYW